MIWNRNSHIWGVSFLKFCDLKLILSFWILRGQFWIWFFIFLNFESCFEIRMGTFEGSFFWHFVIWTLHVWFPRHPLAIHGEVHGVGPLIVHGGFQHQIFCKIYHKYTQIKVFEALLGYYTSFETHLYLSHFWDASASLWVQ